jgi:anion-transporting  ArsA/GET3 family ATPase
MDAHDNPPIPDPTIITSYESDGVVDLFDDDVVDVAETIVWIDLLRTKDFLDVVVNALFVEMIDVATITKISDDKC